MTTLRFVLEVEVDRESGKFASRDEISEKITEALSDIEDVDLTGLGADSESVYTIVSYGVEEVDNKQLKAEWQHNERRVREELPGDEELRKKVRALTHEVKTKVGVIRNLQRELERAHEDNELGKTNVFVREGYDKPNRYLPDGVHDRVSFKFGDREDERFDFTRLADGSVEVRMDTMGHFDLMVKPWSGNVLHVVPVRRVR